MSATGCIRNMGCDVVCSDCDLFDRWLPTVVAVAEIDGLTALSEEDCDKCEGRNGIVNLGYYSSFPFTPGCHASWHRFWECCDLQYGAAGQINVYLDPNGVDGDDNTVWDLIAYYVAFDDSFPPYHGNEAHKSIAEGVTIEELLAGGPFVLDLPSTLTTDSEDPAGNSLCDTTSASITITFTTPPGTETTTDCPVTEPPEIPWGAGCSCGGEFDNIGNVANGVFFFTGWEDHICETEGFSFYLATLNGSWSASSTAMSDGGGSWHTEANLGDYQSTSSTEDPDMIDPGELVYTEFDGVDPLIEAWFIESRKTLYVPALTAAMVLLIANMASWTGSTPILHAQWYNYDEERWNHISDTPQILLTALELVGNSRQTMCEFSLCGTALCTEYSSFFNTGSEVTAISAARTPVLQQPTTSRASMSLRYQTDHSPNTFTLRPSGVVVVRMGAGTLRADSVRAVQAGGGGGYGLAIRQVGVDANVNEGDLLQVTVGAGGAGGPFNTSGSIGEQSQVTSELGSEIFVQGEPGTPGGPGGFAGDSGYNGGDAGNTTTNDLAGGFGGSGGGGGAGPNAAGSNGTTATTADGAEGGDGGWFPGEPANDPGEGGKGGDTGQPGEDGYTPGGGGGGGGAGAAGGSGADGQVRIRFGNSQESTILCCVNVITNDPGP